MIYYTLLQSDTNKTAAQKAEEISREMFKVSRPVSNARDISQYMFAWEVHPNGTMAALEIDDDQDLPVHVQAKLDKLLSYFDKVATKEEKDTLTEAITGKAGELAKVADLLPTKIPKFTKKDLVNMGFKFAEIKTN